jgi:hypothetical protein
VENVTHVWPRTGAAARRLAPPMVVLGSRGAAAVRGAAGGGGGAEPRTTEVDFGTEFPIVFVVAAFAGAGAIGVVEDEGVHGAVMKTGDAVTGDLSLGGSLVPRPADEGEGQAQQRRRFPYHVSCSLVRTNPGRDRVRWEPNVGESTV